MVFYENESWSFILWLREKNKIDVKFLIWFKQNFNHTALAYFPPQLPTYSPDDQREINHMQRKTSTEQTNSICSQLKPNVLRH